MMCGQQAKVQAVGCSDFKLMAELNRPHPEFRLRLRRTMLLARILRRNCLPAMVALFAARASNRSWLQAVEENFRGFVTDTPELKELAEANFAEWSQFLQNSTAAKLLNIVCVRKTK